MHMLDARAALEQFDHAATRGVDGGLQVAAKAAADVTAAAKAARSRLQSVGEFLIAQVAGWAAGGAPLLGLRLSELLRALLRQVGSK